MGLRAAAYQLLLSFLLLAAASRETRHERRRNVKGNARPRVHRRRAQEKGGKSLGLLPDAVMTPSCRVAPYGGGGNYSAGAGAVAVPYLAPVAVVAWMVDATRQRIATIGADAQDRCVAVGGVATRLRAPNVFIAGWSRSGTTSLRAGLARVPRNKMSAADVGSNPSRPAEGLYYKDSAKGGYATYLERAFKATRAWPARRSQITTAASTPPLASHCRPASHASAVTAPSCLPHHARTHRATRGIF